MTAHLYKVSPPRADLSFFPSPFWHTADWESSTTRFRAGYLKDDVLFAGDFEEVSVHLFPRVRRVRVRSFDADVAGWNDVGVQCAAGTSACIFIHHSRREEVESFEPTIFKFCPEGFVRVRRGEYISRAPQHAMSAETLSIAEAVKRWNIQACYVDDIDGLMHRLRAKGVCFDEQT